MIDVGESKVLERKRTEALKGIRLGDSPTLVFGKDLADLVFRHCEIYLRRRGLYARDQEPKQILFELERGHKARAYVPYSNCVPDNRLNVCQFLIAF